MHLAHPRLIGLLLGIIALLQLKFLASSAAFSAAPNEIYIPGFQAKIVFHDAKAALSILPQAANASHFYTLKFSHLVEANASETTPFQSAAFDQAIVYVNFSPASCRENYDSNNIPSVSQLGSFYSIS